jgi:hypothetical protein
VSQTTTAAVINRGDLVSRQAAGTWAVATAASPCVDSKQLGVALGSVTASGGVIDVCLVHPDVVFLSTGSTLSVADPWTITTVTTGAHAVNNTTAAADLTQVKACFFGPVPSGATGNALVTIRGRN